MANNNGKPTTSEQTYMHTITILQSRIQILEKQLENKVLFGKDEIMQAYKMTDHTFRKWVKMGLPVLIVDRTCYAYRDNIDEFFKAITRVNSKNIDMD